ncbi:MAG: FixH family protein [Pirellulaceae bacterium]
MNATTIEHTQGVDAKNENFHRMLWTGIILSFFLIQAVIWTIAITLTANDPSHVIVDGYDQDPKTMEAERQEMLASRALGWHANFEIKVLDEIFGRNELRLSLTDRDGKPISGANISLRVFHNALASEVQEVSMNETEERGVYIADAMMRKSGWWTFEGVARHDGTKYLVDEKFRYSK